LGIEFRRGVTRGELDRLIREAQASAAPTDEQLGLARHFGVEVTPGMTSGELSKQLDPIVRQRAIAAMQANPALRANKVIFYLGQPYTITFIGSVNRRHYAELKPLAASLLWDRPGLQVPIAYIADAVEYDPSTVRTTSRRRRQPVSTH
jgi:hypothetical protein